MKISTCILFLTLTSAFCVNAQLNLKHNGIRLGDKIIKQQVEYKEPGEAGINKLWDFSRLKTINDAYELTYSSPPIQGDSLYMMGNNHFDVKKTGTNELIVGTEHNTIYYYRLKNDSLLLLGHENPAVRLQYTQPIVDMIYPTNYGQNVTVNYESAGLYSGTVNIHTKGSVQVRADAFGKMILPTRDTLQTVLRIKTTKLILDTLEEQPDSTSINKGTLQETYKWFTKGYRYPIFETVRNINLVDRSEIFSTAFFFPPQDHYYLDNDPENLAILDSIWNVAHNISETVNLDNNANLFYNYYPNPVESQLTIEYSLESPSTVNLEIYSMEGRLVKNKIIEKQDKGIYFEYLNCSSLSKGTYILRIKANNKSTSDKIIKK